MMQEMSTVMFIEKLEDSFHPAAPFVGENRDLMVHCGILKSSGSRIY